MRKSRVMSPNDSANPLHWSVYPDADALAQAAAERITRAARESIAARGRFTLALAGGSTPEKTYRLLADVPFARDIDWTRVLLFFGDERFVPRDDERSNYALAARTLLSVVPAAPDRVFPVDTTLPTPADAAAAYAETVCVALAGDVDEDGTPIFDLILLGLGDDGHTASLFPHKPSLDCVDAFVVASPPGVLPPPVDRITFTYPLLNAARTALFLIAGKNKAEAVQDILENAPDWHDRPAAGVAASEVLYYLDEAAAARLSPK